MEQSITGSRLFFPSLRIQKTTSNYLTNLKPIAMKKSSKLILLFLLFCQAAVFAQNITVTGKVTTPLSEPISGVTIKVAGSKQGTTSGETGNFSINVSSKA